MIRSEVAYAKSEGCRRYKLKRGKRGETEKNRGGEKKKPAEAGIWGAGPSAALIISLRR
jgi:hypothetical protein